MGMTRTEKTDEVGELNGLFSDSEIVVLTHYSGLTVSAITQLRKDLRAEGGSFKVTKNTLARRALKGTKFEALEDKFTGPTGVAVSKDPVAAARVAHKFAKGNDKLVILGGALGAQVLDAEGVKRLASLPSLDELRGKLVGLIQAPATKIAGVLQAPAGQLARVVGAHAAKGE